MESSEISEIKEKGWWKEISVMESTPRGTIVNWDPIFKQEAVFESMLPSLAPNPYMAQRIRLSLEGWRDRMADMVHFPRMSSKQMSRSTTRLFETQREERMDPGDIFDQRWYQRMKRDGFLLGGEVELRQRWYQSNMKPRTYCAQGGLAYNASAPTQELFNELVNCFPVTNYRTRLRPSRLRLSLGKYLRIGDLEAFTSRMEEQRSLLNSLSVFCSGHPFTYLDSRDGLVTEDMGEIIWKYNVATTQFAPISFERWNEETSGIGSRHHVAGFLGVYGNLPSCTFGHGALLSHTVDHEDKVNVAGDDLSVEEDDTTESLTDAVVNALGKDQKEKRFRSDEPGCICLKRPLFEEYGQLIQGLRIIPPGLYTVLHHGFGIKDPRYRHFGSDEMSSDEHLRVIASEVVRFSRSAFQCSATLLPEDKLLVMRYCRFIRDKIGFPKDGACVGISGHAYNFPYIDDDPEVFLSEDPMRATFMMHYRPGVTVQERLRIDPLQVADFLEPGQSFRYNPTPYLKYLEKMGHISKEPVLVHSTLSQEKWLEYLDLVDVPPVFEYMCITPVPDQLRVWL
jgi:hypothetical protein